MTIMLHLQCNLYLFMPKKSDFLNNLQEFTVEQITEAIKTGTVTIYELSKSGNLTPLLRRRIEEKLAAKTIESPSAIPLTVKDEALPDMENEPLEEIEIPKPIDTYTPYEMISSDERFETTADSAVDPATHDISSNSDSKQTPKKRGLFKRLFSFCEIWKKQR